MASRQADRRLPGVGNDRSGQSVNTTSRNTAERVPSRDKPLTVAAWFYYARERVKKRTRRPRIQKRLTLEDRSRRAIEEEIKLIKERLAAVEKLKKLLEHERWL